MLVRSAVDEHPVRFLNDVVGEEVEHLRDELGGMDGVVPRVGELGKDVEIKVHAAGHVHAKDVPFFLVLLRDRLPDSDERPWPKPRSWWE